MPAEQRRQRKFKLRGSEKSTNSHVRYANYGLATVSRLTFNLALLIAICRRHFRNIISSRTPRSSTPPSILHAGPQPTSRLLVKSSGNTNWDCIQDLWPRVRAQSDRDPLLSVTHGGRVAVFGSSLQALANMAVEGADIRSTGRGPIMCMSSGQYSSAEIPIECTARMSSSQREG